MLSPEHAVVGHVDDHRVAQASRVAQRGDDACYGPVHTLERLILADAERVDLVTPGSTHRRGGADPRGLVADVLLVEARRPGGSQAGEGVQVFRRGDRRRVRRVGGEVEEQRPLRVVPDEGHRLAREDRGRVVARRRAVVADDALVVQRVVVIEGTGLCLPCREPVPPRWDVGLMLERVQVLADERRVVPTPL